MTAVARRLLLIAAGLIAFGCSTDPQIVSEFSLAVSPAVQSITLSAGQSGTASYTVTSTQVTGTAQTITLSISGLPSGVTGAFNPTTLNGAGTSRLTLTANSGAAAGNATFIVSGSADSGIHTAQATITICIPGQVSLAVTQVDTYACHDPYKASFVVTNGTCAPITVTSVTLTGTTNPSQCTATGTDTYPLSPAVTVAASSSATALALTGGHFCCNASPCPAMFTCNESFSFTAVTSAGTYSAPAQNATINLGGCTGEVCPNP